MRKKNDGFGLLSIIISLAIFSILSTVSVRSYRSYIANERMRVITSRLIAALSNARQLAMDTGHAIRFCPESASTAFCGVDWTVGQLITTVGDDSTVLKYYPRLPSGYRLFFQGTLSMNKVLEWRPTGFTTGQQGSFWLCKSVAGKMRSNRIIVLRTGRVRLVRSMGCG